MDIIKSGFCSKLTSEFDSRMSQMNKYSSQLDEGIRNLKVGLSQVIGWSPKAAINDFQNKVNANIDSMIPSLSEFDQLIDIANKCVFTNNDSMLSKPSTLARSIKGSVKNNANSVLSSLAAAIPSEFSIAGLVNAIKSSLLGGNLSGIIGQANQALVCASSICGTDITSRAAQISNFLSKYSLNSDGELDTAVLLYVEGVAEEQIDSICKVFDSIDGVMTNIDTTFDSGVSRVKSLYYEANNIYKDVDDLYF